MNEQHPGCLFCQIAAGEKSAAYRYKDEEVVAFDDIHPKAPTHILIVPKRHIASVAELRDTDQELAGKLILTAQALAKEQGIEETGYRLVFNTKDHGGQIIDHIHLHLLGGKPLGSMA